MNFKKLLSLLLATAMLLMLVACNDQPASPASSTAEVASSTPVILTEEEAWKLEPAYGLPIRYWLSDGCTSGPVMADKLGYFEEAGLIGEGVKGTSYTEALGTATAEVAVGHIATMLVPSTNGVNLTFTGGAHVGCKSLYVLADSDYQTTEDLRGLKISVPNGIGASDYNITACLLDSDGINPLTDVNLVQVETSACVISMQNGEIAAALLTDTYAYNMVKDGLLRSVRSLLDEDWNTTPCCVIAMNATFVKENPITATKVTDAVQKAHLWMDANPEEATQMLLDLSLNNGDFDMNVEINTGLDFGLTNEAAQAGLERIAEAYIKLGIITSMSTTEEVMAKAWSPLVTE